MQHPSSMKSSSREKPPRLSADEQFSMIMQLRLQTIKDKACCESHQSTPMHIDGYRLACCAGTGVTCKIKEIQFLMEERKRLASHNDQLISENKRMIVELRECKSQFAQAHKEIADLQAQNNEMEYHLNCKRSRADNDSSFGGDFKGWSGAFPVVPYEPFPQVQKTAATVVHYHNTTNVMNINFVGNEIIRRHGVKLLTDACKPGGNFLGAVTDLLEENPTPENVKLLQLKAVDPQAFQQAVVETVKPLVPDVPEEMRAKIQQGLTASAADTTVGVLQQ
jgi:hypothetical protein